MIYIDQYLPIRKKILLESKKTKTQHSNTLIEKHTVPKNCFLLQIVSAWLDKS